MMCDCALFTKQ